MPAGPAAEVDHPAATHVAERRADMRLLQGRQRIAVVVVDGRPPVVPVAHAGQGIVNQLLSPGYANPAAADGDDRLRLERFAMPLDQPSHQCDSLSRRNVGQSNQARVRNIMEVNEFSKIGVERH